MRIVLGSDHGGYELKEVLKDWLKEEGYELVDVGTDSKESVDYPIYGHRVGKAVAQGEAEFGITVCGSGLGIGMAAGKVKGIRCATVTEPYSAELARRHNNANVVSLGGRLTGVDMAKEIVKTFLNTDFEGGRHQGRIDAIELD